VDAPTYDGKRQTKAWEDTSAPARADANGNVSYLFIAMDASGNVVPATVAMPASEAATVNLYGVHSYPAYVVAPTDATMMVGAVALNSAYLSTQADAVALALTFGMTAADVTDSGQGTINYPADESRRVWVIARKGYQLCAGLLIGEANANGAGAPGHWDFSGAEPNWISDLPSSLPPQNPAWNVPCRPLLANEAIAEYAPMGIKSFVIYRTDMVSTFNPAPTAPPSGGGGLTVDEATTLTSAYALLLKIQAWFRIP
jgi:hypothetical protein